MPQDNLARILEERRLLSVQDLETWIGLAGEERLGLDAILTRENVFSRSEILHFLEDHYFCSAAELKDVEIDSEVLELVPMKVAVRHQLLPLSRSDDTLQVAFANPDDSRASDSIASMTQLTIERQVALRFDLEAAIERNYGRLHDERAAAAAEQAAEQERKAEQQRAEQEHRAAETERAAPRAQVRPAPSLLRLEKDPVQIVDRLISAADEREATDIHVEPRENGLVVRLRIDGIMQEVARLPTSIVPAVTSRFKVLADMDIAERRAPQDGRISIKRGRIMLDLRVSALPSQFGEKIVLRLLRKDSNLLDIEKLGMPVAVRKLHEEMIQAPMGLYLVTGPTGSGKTTTLYSTLCAIDTDISNVVTLEDPIEYTLDGITQVQIHETAGLTFVAGLTSILRQDPDTVLVGEIRNVETAEIAARAALTGHKVFSTLHTNDSCQAVTRLVDMGTPPYLITATLRGVLAQRLVRAICTECRESYEPSATDVVLLGLSKSRPLQRGAGCETCNGSGYKGRLALFEYFRLEDNLHRLVLDRASAFTLRQAAERNGMVPMMEFGKRAVLDGQTTCEELQRVLTTGEGGEQHCAGCQRAVSKDFAICPFCQHVLKESCPSCREPVDDKWEACPNCGEELEREWQKMYCRTCVGPLEPNVDVCPYCGDSVL